MPWAPEIVADETILGRGWTVTMLIVPVEVGTTPEWGGTIGRQANDAKIRYAAAAAIPEGK